MAKQKLEDSTTPTARIDRIEGIDARQCPKCHTIYPMMENAANVYVCKCHNRPFSSHSTRPIKLTIHYGEEGAF